MVFDPYKQNDGTYIFNGGYYSDIESLLCDYYKLPWCGCGSIEVMLKSIRDILKDCDSRESYDNRNLKMDYCYGKKGEFEEGMIYFILYWLDLNKYTEHGGSVGGSWLTEEGYELLKDLNEYIENIKDNE